MGPRAGDVGLLASPLEMAALRRQSARVTQAQRAVVVVFDFLHSESDAPPHLYGRRYGQHTVDWYAGVH